MNASLDPAAGEMVLKRYYHLGVAVASIDRALSFWRDTLGARASEPEEVASDG